MSSRIERHEQNRGKVCGLCLRKPKQIQKISVSVLNLIQKHSYEDYSLEDTSLPVVICTSCVKTLQVIDEGKDDRKLPDVEYSELTKPQAVN